MRRSLILLVLGAPCLLMTGCLDDVLGVLLEPGAVVGNAANGIAAAGAQNIADAQSAANSTAQAVTDINRIIQNDPDPASVARLQGLRDQLISNQAQASNTPFSAHARKAVKLTLRRPNDAMNSERLHTIRDNPKVHPPGQKAELVRRIDPGPGVLADDSSLRLHDPPSFVMQVQPVRLSPRQ